MLKQIVAIAIASVFWFVMFSPWTSSPHINFWYVMLLATGTLTTLSFVFYKELKQQINFNLKDVAIGLASAVLLWVVFYVGNAVSTWMFDFAHPQINSIYDMKGDSDKLFVGLALLFWIGPAEEFFWRGYIQRSMEDKQGRWKAFIITTLIYAFVHIWAFNFMLFMAALICGAFWGLIYMKNRNLLTVLISHAIWDVAIFILFPIS